MTRSALEALRERAARSFEAARSLPPEVFVDEGFLGLELENVFRPEWHCVGREPELAQPGDYLTFEIAGESVIVLRDADHRIRAYPNICRHRMARLLEGSGRVRRIVCPYHAWNYELDGTLASAPFMGEDFDPARCSLPRLAVEIWEGWIYVSLADDPPPLAPRLAPLRERLADYAMAEYEPLFRVDERWETNWKCLVENFTEGYHLFHVHARTVGHVLPTRLVECVPGGEAYNLFLQRRLPDAAYEYDEELEAFNPRLSDESRRIYPLTCIYPAHLVAVSPDRLFWMSLQPDGTRHVRVRWGADAFPGVMPEGEAGARRLAQLRRSLEAINDEDKGIVRDLRANAASRHARSGPLSPLERSLWEFTRYLAGRLAAVD